MSPSDWIVTYLFPGKKMLRDFFYICSQMVTNLTSVVTKNITRLKYSFPVKLLFRVIILVLSAVLVAKRAVEN